MKAEQEIVLQKKMFIIFSLFILAVAMGILNIQKSTVLAATKVAVVEDEEENTTRVYTKYIASEDLFMVEASDSIQMPKGLTQDDENEVEEEIKQEEIIESGEEAGREAVASRGGYIRETNVPPTDYERVITVKATAYCLCQKCCGKSPSSPGYGCTASGLRIVPGTGMKVIAVDPSVVSLGSEVYVEGLNGASNYGYAIAADTGSAIKNNKIDLYMDTHQQALAWGVRNVNLYILKAQ